MSDFLIDLDTQDQKNKDFQNHNNTLILLAAKAGATFISPFIGRLDDLGLNGMDLIYDIVEIYQNYEFKTQVLAASIRGTHHIIEASKSGADIVTIPPKVFKEMYNHPLTEKGLNAFLSDWNKTGKTII